jgi:hypothetical protein
MSTWRRKALEILPAKRELIEEAESPMALWIDLWLEFETAAEQNEEATVRCILEYALWCISPAAGKLPSDASTAAVCAFFEHLPTDEALWPRLPQWLSPSQFESVKRFFHYFLSEADVARLAVVFYSSQRPS